MDQQAFQRVCLYLTSCVPYVPDPENTTLLETALRIFRKFKQFPQVRKRDFYYYIQLSLISFFSFLHQAMRLALQLNRESLVSDIFHECEDELTQKQMAYMLGR